MARVVEEALAPRPAAVRRAVEKSPVILEGMPVRFLRGASTAEVRVLSVFKGEIEPDRTITVDFARQPYGIWPQRGERVLLMLSPAESGDSYVLSGYSGCVVSATMIAVETVAGMIEEIEFARLVEPEPPDVEDEVESVKVVTPEPSPDVHGYTGMIESAETVLVGTLSGIEVLGDSFRALFTVEYGLLGYANYDRPMVVSGPAAGRPGSAGRYAAFLRGADSGDSFVMVSESAMINLSDNIAAEAQVMRAVDAMVDARGMRRSGFTSIQALLSEWRQAWNAGDIDRIIRCYSQRHPLREAYDVGGAERDRLLAQMREFGGRMSASLGQIRRTGMISASGGIEVEAQIFLSVEMGKQLNRHGIRMGLVFEAGEWRILDEGL